jgi:pimeloyl-ACP methyl ester carboxylesterase
MPARRCGLRLALAGALLAIGAGARAGAIDLAPCQVAGLAARCGSHEVFEDRRAHAGRRIALRVVVLPARAANPKPDAIVDLAGGPGAAATGEAPLFAESLAPLRAERDVVLVDLRGTGGSHPLDCDLGLGLLARPLSQPALAACRRKLEAGADLRLYTTAIAMDDLDEVRAALGYPAVDLLAHSYGTLAAQVYLRRHGERVRAAVLEGVVPPEADAFLSYAEDAERALAALLAACAAQPACRAAFPRPREELAEVLRRLAERPVEVPVRTGEGERTAAVALTRDLFAATLRVRLYSPRAAARIPRAIHRAYQGDYADMAHAAWAIDRAGRAGLSEGLMLSVDCAEGLRAITPAAVERRSRDTFLGPEPLLRRLAACASWPRGEPPNDLARPAASPAPTLLISGEIDPVTPPAGAERVRRGLPGSVHLVARGQSHSLEHPCIARTVAAFLAAGSSRGLDSSCLAELPPIPFELGERAIGQARE